MRIFHVIQDGGDGFGLVQFFQATDTVNDDQLVKLLGSLRETDESYNLNEGGASSFNIPDGDHDIDLTDIWTALNIEPNSAEAQAILQDNLVDA